MIRIQNRTITYMFNNAHGAAGANLFLDYLDVRVILNNPRP